jgi:hypothetical protein
MLKWLFREYLCCSRPWLMYPARSHCSLQACEPLSSRIARQFELSTRENKRSTGRHIQAAQPGLSVSACAELPPCWEGSDKAFLREGSGMWSDRSDSHILRAFGLRILVPWLGTCVLGAQMTPSQYPGPIHTTTPQP